ncbi:MAG: hypothetical protein A3D92_17540 [Bacteroidetes bacterium RIFCSPHIGHO2_02_FULL_44_7]|nr:MAG: hypothetical protein A3D92_17540 [Bacteroidetes bacterium RIFCSPHIGHO2_02_FULL_44_7]
MLSLFFTKLRILSVEHSTDFHGSTINVPGIEIISTILFSICQFGFGGWQLTQKNKTLLSGSIRRKHYLLLTLFFLSFNLSNLLKIEGAPYMNECIGVGLGAYFFYFLALRLLPIDTGKTKGIIAVGSLLISVFFVLIFYPLSKGNSHWGLVPLVPVLLSFYLLLATMFSLMGKINREISSLEKIAQMFKQLLLVFLLSGTLIIDLAKPGFQLTVNMVFMVIALEFIFQLQGISVGNLDVFSEPERAEFNFADLLIIEDEDLVQFDLTESEILVAQIMLKGYSVQQISDELERSTDVVYKHVSNIYRKTNTQSPQEFILKMMRISDGRRYVKGNSES